MIDLHCHITFDVDDGARTISESIEMLKEAEKAGFTDILLTPHYLENYYEVHTEQIYEKINELKSIIKEKQLSIQLHMGREIYITPDISKKIIQKEVSSLNETNYILVEIPMQSRILYLEHEIEELTRAGYIPILAHPERYKVVQQDIQYLDPLLKRGVLLQANYGSILGKYGLTAKSTLKKLLKSNKIHFLGSDCHRPRSLYLEIEEAKDKIRKYISEEQLEELTQINAMKILNRY